jgi:hypothetical protein
MARERLKVKGTFTYYFNANYGQRPDVGAKVWIITGRGVDITETDDVLDFSSSELTLVDANHQKTELPIVAMAVADGSGSVTLPNAPVGTYTAVMKSSHAKGGLGGKLNQRDISGRLRKCPITVSVGQVLDISTDFGIWAF